VAREVLAHALLHELNTEIRVVDDLDLVPIPLTIQHGIINTNSQNGTRREDTYLLSLLCFLALSKNRLPMVKTPDANDEMRSLPAQVVTMVFMAQDTAGPWSPVSMSTISTNSVGQGGRPRKRVLISKGR
jgi:hypothetical protein